MKSLKLNSPLVREQELAKILSVDIKTLRNMRLRDEGPPYVRIGRKSIRYDLSLVGEFLSKNMASQKKAI